MTAGPVYKKCGYCSISTTTPCTDGKAAMACARATTGPMKRTETNPLGDAFLEGEKPKIDFPEGIPLEDWRKAVEGTKDDAGKPRMDLLPPELLFAVATVLAFGAKKYDDRNWEKGMSWGRVFAALMRHLWAWWRGEKTDDETGFSHLWHAGCCIAFLIAFEARDIGEDDRNKETK